VEAERSHNNIGLSYESTTAICSKSVRDVVLDDSDTEDDDQQQQQQPPTSTGSSTTHSLDLPTHAKCASSLLVTCYLCCCGLQ